MAGSEIRLNFSAAGAQEAASAAAGVASSLEGVASGAKAADAGLDGILASVRKVQASLAKAGGGGPKEVAKALKGIEDALSPKGGGDASPSAIAKAVESLYRVADGLPPKEFVEFANELDRIAGASMRAAESLAKASKSEFRIDTGGMAARDSVKGKLAAMDAASGIASGLAEIGKGMGGLASDEAAKLQERIAAMRDILAGEIGPKAVKAIRREAELLTKTMDGLSQEALKGLGKTVDDVIGKLDGLADGFDKAGENASGLEAVVSEVTSRLGVEIGGIDRRIVQLAAHIPGIGKAIKAITTALSGPIGWAIAAIGLIASGINKLMEYATAARERVTNIKLDNLESTLRVMNEDTERQLRLLDLEAKRRQEQKRLLDEQLAAEKSITDHLLQRQRLKETRAGMTDEERFDADEKFGAMQDKADADNARKQLEADRQKNEKDIAKLKKKIALLKEQADNAQKLASASRAAEQRLNDKAAGMGFRQGVSDVGGTLGATLREADRHDKIATEAHQQFKSAKEKIEDLKEELEAAEGKGKGFDKRSGEIDRTLEMAEEKRRRAREEEDLRRKNAQAEFDRRKAVRSRDEQDWSSEYARRRDEWMKTEAQRLEDASLRLARFGTEAERARRKMEEMERKYGRPDAMNAKMRRAYDAAVADWERAREKARQAQSEVDEAKRRKEERKWSDEDRQRQWLQEDEDFERQGKYDLAGWDGKVAMDRERMETGKALRISADRQLDNRQRLTPREIQLLEAQRERGRSMETESRGSLRQLLREGDRETAAFEAKMRGAGGNRLTQMGLGGNGEDFARSTAKNTGRLVALTGEMLSTFRNGGLKPKEGGRLGDVTWKMR